MLNFKEFMKEFYSHNKDLVDDYNRITGDDLLKCDSFYDTKIYKEYLSRFDNEKLDFIIKKLKKPSIINNEIDYKFLLLLVVGSFSSDWFLGTIYDKEDIKFSLVIDVKKDEYRIVKRCDLLDDIIIEIMEMIYLREEIEIHGLFYIDKKEAALIEKMREKRIEYFNQEFERIKIICESMDGDSNEV